MGRPSLYTDELAKEICERLVNETLSAICRDDHIPLKGTVLSWVERDISGFADRYARARSSQIESMSHELLSIADDSSEDVVTRYNEKGEPYQVVDQEHINRARLRVDTRKWLLSRLRPKVYGESVQANIDGTLNVNVNVSRINGKPEGTEG